MLSYITVTEVQSEFEERSELQLQNVQNNSREIVHHRSGNVPENEWGFQFDETSFALMCRCTRAHRNRSLANEICTSALVKNVKVLRIGTENASLSLTCFQIKALRRVYSYCPMPSVSGCQDVFFLRTKLNQKSSAVELTRIIFFFAMAFLRRAHGRWLRHLCNTESVLFRKTSPLHQTTGQIYTWSIYIVAHVWRP